MLFHILDSSGQLIGAIYQDGEQSALKLGDETFVGPFSDLKTMVLNQYPAAEFVAQEDDQSEEDGEEDGEEQKEEQEEEQEEEDQSDEDEGFQWLRYKHNTDLGHDGWGDEGFRPEGGG